MNFINRILIAFAGLCISLSACSSEPSENTEIYIPLDRQIQNARRNTSSASFEIAGAKYKRISGNIVEQNKQRLIFNPITNYDFPDPTVIKIGDYYYAAATGFPIRILRSSDMANWEAYRTVFPGQPLDPFGIGVESMHIDSEHIGYWAPSLAIVDGKVTMFLYVIDSHTYIRATTKVLQAESIDGEFRLKNTLLDSKYDPYSKPGDTQYFCYSDGQQYVSFGDVNNDGIYIARLKSDGTTIDGTPWRIDGTENREGSILYYHDGWYYLFYSGGRTDQWHYNVSFRRSKDITAQKWSDEKVILVAEGPNSILCTTGHAGEIIPDSKGNLYMYMHCHCVGLNQSDSVSYGQRYFFVQNLRFGADGPYFVDRYGTPTTKPQWFIQAPTL